MWENGTMFRGEGAVVSSGRCVSGHDNVRFAVPFWFHFNVAELVRRIRIRVRPSVQAFVHPSTTLPLSLFLPSLCVDSQPLCLTMNIIHLNSPPAYLLKSRPHRSIRQRHISHAVLLLRRDFPLLVFVDDVDVLFAVLFDRDEES